MKYLWLACLITLISCGGGATKEERLARQHCASCHLFPEPTELDKETWDKHVLPQMAFRMGLTVDPLMKMNQDDVPYVIQTLPKSQLVTTEEFESIRNYFLREAPDSLPPMPAVVASPLTQFDASAVRLPHFTGSPVISMVAADTTKKNIWISTRQSDLIAYSYNWMVRDSLKLSSPVSAMLFSPGESPLMTAMGIMDPNDQPKGQILRYASPAHVSLVADSLKRPVFLEEADFNGDGMNDLVACAFGNYGGELVVLENTGSSYLHHTISYLPGARNVVVRDFNNDDRPDILALFTQGDEQISLLTNAGNFNFRINTLLRFSPVMGSSYFEIADFDKNGSWDILYTNGDNADYSIIMKPYHGVHLFLNDGRNQFNESWFHAMPGSSKAMARDFDGDGDLDIAAISFFPDFDKNPETGFIYFQNDGSGFSPQTTPLGAAGRWLVMDILDIDGDKDEDVVVGALNFNDAIPRTLSARWEKEPVDLLVLKNNQTK